VMVYFVSEPFNLNNDVSSLDHSSRRIIYTE